MNDCKPLTPKRLIDLNVDVMMHLFTFLELKEQLSLVRSHNSFNTAYAEYARIHFKTISTLRLTNLPAWALERFFSIAGACIKTLLVEYERIQPISKHVIELIIKYTPYVEKLSISGDDEEHYLPLVKLIIAKDLAAMLHSKPLLRCLRLSTTLCDLLNVINQLPLLENLYFNYLDYGHDLALENLLRLKLDVVQVPSVLFKMMRLKALSLSLKDETVLKALADLTAFQRNLEILYIQTGPASRWELDWCRKLERLKHLRFTLVCRNNSLSDHLNLSVLLAQKQNLASLQIYNFERVKCDNCHVIAQFTQLRKLHLTNAVLTDDGLKAFAALTNLIELSLQNGSKFSHKALLFVIENCQRLKWLNIQKSDIDVDGFAKALLPIITMRMNSTNECITIFSFKCGKDFQSMDSLKAYEIEPLKSLVKFVFERVKSYQFYDNFYDVFENEDGMGPNTFFESETTFI